MLGAAESAGVGVEVLLLLLVVVVPNRLGVGVEDDEVVELVGLLAMKENDGFEAAGSVWGEIIFVSNKAQ